MYTHTLGQTSGPEAIGTDACVGVSPSLEIIRALDPRAAAAERDELLYVYMCVSACAVHARGSREFQWTCVRVVLHELCIGEESSRLDSLAEERKSRIRARSEGD